MTTTRIAAFIFVSAFVLRAGLEWGTGDIFRPPFGDEIEFLEIAQQMLDGNGFSRNGETPTAQRLPGYPGFLALVALLFGPSTVVARLANIGLSSLLALCVFLLGVKTIGRTAGIVAGAFAVVHLPFVENSAYLMADTAYSLACGFAVLAAGDGRESWTWRRAASVGTLIGLAALFRAEVALFAGLVGLWLLVTTGDKRRCAILVVAFSIPLILAVGPWLARNHAEFGRFKMATVGHALVGIYNDTTFNSPDKRGDWVPEPRELRNANAVPAKERAPGFVYVPEEEWDQELTRRALASIRENAGALPQMVLSKLYRLTFDVSQARSLARTPLLILFVLGTAWIIASRMLQQTVFMWLFIVQNVAVTILLYSNARLRMSMDVPFLVIAAFGICEQGRLFLERRRETAAGAGPNRGIAPPRTGEE